MTSKGYHLILAIQNRSNGRERKGAFPTDAQCQGGGAIDVGMSSSAAEIVTTIPATQFQTESTGLTSVTVRIQQGIKKGQGSASRRWPRSGAMVSVIQSLPLQ